LPTSILKTKTTQSLTTAQIYHFLKNGFYVLKNSQLIYVQSD